MTGDTQNTAILWFREDLRLGDHPALHAALDSGAHLVCVYILDDETHGLRALGGAARWWLHGALVSLRESLEKRGGNLLVLRGKPEVLLPKVAEKNGAGAVFCHARYQKEACLQDERVASALNSKGITFHQKHGTLLRSPDTVMTRTGTPFKVFGAYWKAANAHGAPPAPLPAPRSIPFASRPTPPDRRDALDENTLLPSRPDWAGGLRDTWEPGEDAAHEMLEDFVRHGLRHYDTGRNEMAAEGSSRLSPYLRWGHVSPRQVWHEAAKKHGPDTDVFLDEIGWREFSWYTLYHQSHLPNRNLKPAFDALTWRRAAGDRRAWQRGQTGIPVVDAGMRQLWETGWMHNRARMIVGSFLVKHLLIDWKEGESWFWDTLVDADPASNAVNWQWVAGTGVEATPFFRIFNPLRQGEKFDTRGDYVRRWVPELARLPDDVIHAPWDADDETLRKGGVTLGKTYPKPVVDLAGGRQRALDAYRAVRRS